MTSIGSQQPPAARREVWELTDDHGVRWCHEIERVLVEWVTKINTERPAPNPPLYPRQPQLVPYDARKPWAGTHPVCLGKLPSQ